MDDSPAVADPSKYVINRSRLGFYGIAREGRPTPSCEIIETGLTITDATRRVGELMDLDRKAHRENARAR